MKEIRIVLPDEIAIDLSLEAVIAQRTSQQHAAVIVLEALVNSDEADIYRNATMEANGAPAQGGD